MKHRNVALAIVIVMGIGVGAVASAGGKSPEAEGEVPKGIPESNIHYGNEVVVWGDNDAYVASWKELLAETEAEAEAAREAGSESEYQAHLRAVERLRQDIEALCALSKTTVC